MLLDMRCMAKKYLKFFLCVLTASLTSGAHVEPTRYDLIHYLLSDTRYDHSLPPDFYTGSVTNVSVEMVITDLNYESDINMEYDCTLYLRLNWTDRRLDFSSNSTTYESLKLGDDIVDKIWIPDLFFHHERKSELHGLFTKNQLVYIFRNGSVLYSGRFNVKSNCQMDLKKYPFDTQTCPIVIQSYAFTKEDIMLHWNGKNAVKIDHTANLDFIEKSLKHTYISPYADPVGNFSTLVAKISFKRPKESFQIMYVAPAIILVSVSFTSFLLGDSVASRIIVPTGALTQLIMQWAGIYNKLPPVSVLTQLDMWMLTNLAFVGVVLIVNAVICHFVILKDKKEKDAKEAKAEGKTKVENATVKSNINGKNGHDLGDKGEGLQLSGSKVKQPKSEQGSGKKDLESCSEKSPLIPNAQKKQYTLEKKYILQVGDIPEKDATGGNGVGVSYSNPAFTGPTRKSTNGKVDAKQKKELDALKEDFFELLDSNEDITTSTEWKAVEEVVKEDPRYKRVSRNDDEMAKLWYKEYIDEKQKKDFLSLLEEKARKIKEWERAEWKIDHDPRYVVVEDTKREKWFQEYRWRKCIFNRIKWSSNVRSVNFICFMTLAVLYCLFVTCFYCVWSSDIQ